LKLLVSTLMAVLLAVGPAWAENDAKKVGKGAENAGKTVVHGTNAVGKGASKVYHDLAHKTHKVIARNTDDPHKKSRHIKKAAIHYKHADRKAKQSDKVMDKAENAADKVVK
jgi:hypothetical protein